MKVRMLIFSLLLSLFACSRVDNGVVCVLPESESTLSETPSSDALVDFSPNRDFCITAAQGQTFAGDGFSNTVSAPVSSAVRRTTPQTKSTFRILKSGKVIDNNHSHPFLTPSFVVLSGIHIPWRLLFSMCRLRL